MTEIAVDVAQMASQRKLRRSSMGLLRPKIAKLFVSLLPTAYKAVIVNYQTNRGF